MVGVRVTAQPEDPAARDLRRPASPEAVPPGPVAPPRATGPDQAQRRGIGAWLHVLGALVDGVIIGGVALVVASPYAETASPDQRLGLLKLCALYAVVATGLLIRTHRWGRRVRRPSDQLASVCGRLAIAPMIAITLNWWTSSIDKRLWLTLLVLTVPAVLVGRLAMFTFIHAVRERGYDLEDTLMVGAGPVAREVVSALERHPEMGLLPVGFVDRYDEELSLPTLGRPEQLPEILEATGVRHVVLAFGAAPEVELVTCVRQCSHLPVRFYTIPRFFELGVPDRRGIEVDGFTLIPLEPPGRLRTMWPLKRAVDLVVSLVLLVLAAPVLLACAVAVRLSGPGPVIFRQERISIDHIPFHILKFRTMRHVADPELQARLDQAVQSVQPDDERITRVGAFLRASHLDELPQLVNVVKGEMSLVGPRPERTHFVDQHSGVMHGYAHRHRVPAGITGWAQVNGFWGDSSLETRVRLDNRYIESWSPWRDLVIGLRTIPTLFGRRR